MPISTKFWEKQLHYKWPDLLREVSAFLDEFIIFAVQSYSYCVFLWLICQEKCLLHGIIVHKEEHAMMIGGPLSMETISTIETGTSMWIGAATTTTSGIIAISVISPRGNSGTMSMVMLTLLLLDQLLKGENLVWILGESVVGDTTLSTMHMNALINQLTTIQPLWSQDPMLRSLHLHLWVANVTAQNWKKMNQYFCQRMRLRDTPHQEKMELMHYVKHICVILIVPSFRILGCGWSCKCSTWNVSSYYFLFGRFLIRILMLLTYSFDSCRPQTTIGTAMVLCHRFFVRRSHACHDRFVSS